MADLTTRNPANPILRPDQVRPSQPDLVVECLLNPGVFQFEGATWLIVRVAERPKQKDGQISFPILESGETRILSFDLDDPKLDTSDPREPIYDREVYLSTLSHLRLFKSSDGIHFEDPGLPNLVGEGDMECYGIEDCRVASMDNGEFLLTYSATSPSGVGVGLKRTRDWKEFENFGMILPPANKDCAIFESKIDDQYVCFHRPSGVGLGGNYIWLASSPDLHHWGNHTCIARTRPGSWDSKRIGAGAAPIRTERGWLAIYHGADHDNRYCLGALLLDQNDPTRVLARSEEPLMEPVEEYEQKGFFGNVVFTNGHTVDGDEVTIYYGASDTVICVATLSIKELLCTKMTAIIHQSYKLHFSGVPGRDIYNITAPFQYRGKNVIAGRVEKRDEEFSEIHFFEETVHCTVPECTVYSHPVYTVQSAPSFPGLQDPCITTIDGKLLLGGVRFPVTFGDDKLAWQMEFYIENDSGDFDLVLKGPPKMKDIRFVQLPDNRIVILTRPQGEKGGRGSIGYTIVESLNDVTNEIIEAAPLFDLCPPDQWVGANEAHVLSDGRIGVLGHIANFDNQGNRHYYAMAFTFQPDSGDCTQPKLIAKRCDFPKGQSKRPDLVDVIFSGGLARLPGGKARLYAGLSDAEAGWVNIDDPFSGQ